MLRTTAERAEKAWMSRKSKVEVFSPGARVGEMVFHVVPLLVVRRTVALVPESHVILLETGERPRNCWEEFVGLRVQDRCFAVVFGRRAVRARRHWEGFIV
jgi:hypothetical protein